MMEAIRDISMFLTRFTCSSSYGDTSYSSYAKTTVERFVTWIMQLRIQKSSPPRPTTHTYTHTRHTDASKPTCKPHSPVDPEAVFLPARATLTLANLKGAVMLQGVLGLQALQAGVCTQGRHGLLGRTVLQQAIEHHAGLLLNAALLCHQTVQGRRHWHITWRKDTVNITTNVCSRVYGPVFFFKLNRLKLKQESRVSVLHRPSTAPQQAD